MNEPSYCRFLTELHDHVESTPVTGPHDFKKSYEHATAILHKIEDAHDFPQNSIGIIDLVKRSLHEFYCRPTARVWTQKIAINTIRMLEESCRTPCDS